MELDIKQLKKPFLIAGPCSVESEEQVFTIAQELKRECAPALLRGGIWKPRTRPNSFEGVGAIGLPWLVNAGKSVNIPVATEVANAKHVEEALKAGVNVLWIGARTTANPFAVQDIADALKGVKITVMVKNPINPDLMLWLGAFERLENAGITSLIAIHRGFSVYNHPQYRNVPNWAIPIALKEERSDIPIIGDPSHISGKREGLFSLAQKALDLNYAGLMLEVHNTPEKAWSDAQQQITPTAYKELIQNLILRSEFIQQKEESSIQNARKRIAAIDDQLFSLLKDRMKIAEEIGAYKKDHQITILQTEQWKNILETRLSNAKSLGLSEEFMKEILDAIHEESIRHQTEVMNRKES
ncbi:MAG: bifunctional 3-deoxy-7-phosphoheptulonate synthase/chorismate mutase type II [Brumimicrobium sp.]|nr:bifunctional 3-deoxy-7-phosphoheptulonate synthase/chorismate mutase type II [Brumimicrobium sp.]